MYISAVADDGIEQRATYPAACVVGVVVAPDEQLVRSFDDFELLALDTRERLERRAG
jgi:hypothetical protein